MNVSVVCPIFSREKTTTTTRFSSVILQMPDEHEKGKHADKQCEWALLYLAVLSCNNIDSLT